MKMIALDTAAMSVETGGDFTRLRDFDDVIAIMNHKHYDTDDLREMFSDYIEPSTCNLVKRYQEEGTDGINEWLHETQKQYQEDTFMYRALSNPKYELSGNVRAMLQELYERAETEKDDSDRSIKF